MEYRILNGWAEINRHKEQIIGLFEKLFNRNYPQELWSHFYHDIPCGDSIGICVFEGNKIVGYSALLPQEIYDTQTNKIVPYGLSVSTMILPGYRFGGQTFSTLLDYQKQVARQHTLLFILSFPNQNSYLPLTHFAKFKLLDEARIVTGSIKDDYGRFLVINAKRAFFTKRLWEWRISRFNYKIRGGYITKYFQGQEQALDLIQNKFTDNFTGVYPLWKSSMVVDKNIMPISDYVIRLCYYSISPSFDMALLKRSVLLSDVF